MSSHDTMAVLYLYTHLTQIQSGRVSPRRSKVRVRNLSANIVMGAGFTYSTYPVRVAIAPASRAAMHVGSTNEVDV